MAENKSDYLTQYKQFFEHFAQTVNPDDPLPLNVAGYNLSECEVRGEIVDWTLQYLNQKNCPSSLLTPIAKTVIEEVTVACKDVDNYSLKPQGSSTYQALRLMQVVTRKIDEVCLRYRDNGKMATLPPPTSGPPFSACAIKNSRRKMEDRHVIIDDFHGLFNVQDPFRASYYAVFDGHAGQDAAMYSVAHLHQFLAESPHYPTDPERAIRDAFQKTDKLFVEKSERDNVRSGTTAVCALLQEKTLYVAWLGDSEALLVRDGQPVHIVTPHKPEREDEKERIQNMGGCVMFWGTWRVNGQLAVSRAIGDPEYKPYVIAEPDVATIPLDGREDFLILACDGLWDYLSREDALQTIYRELRANPDKLELVSEALVKLSKKQGSTDNITVIVVFLRDPSELAAQDPRIPRLPQPAADGQKLLNGDNMETSFNSFLNGPDAKKNHLELDAGGEPQLTTFASFARKQQNGEGLFLNHETTTNGGGDDVLAAFAGDLGPETNVDIDDSGFISPAATGGAATAVPGTDTANLLGFTEEVSDYELQRQQGEAFDPVREAREETPTPPADEVPDGAGLISIPDTAVEADNVAEDAEDSDDDWRYYRVEPSDSSPLEVDKLHPGEGEKQETVPSPVADRKLQLPDLSTPDDMESSATHPELLMESQLNPDAAEFVPVSPTSPPGEKENEDPFEVDKIPTQFEFQQEVKSRPSDLDFGVDLNSSGAPDIIQDSAPSHFDSFAPRADDLKDEIQATSFSEEEVKLIKQQPWTQDTHFQESAFLTETSEAVSAHSEERGRNPFMESEVREKTKDCGKQDEEFFPDKFQDEFDPFGSAPGNVAELGKGLVDFDQELVVRNQVEEVDQNPFSVDVHKEQSVIPDPLTGMSEENYVCEELRIVTEEVKKGLDPEGQYFEQVEKVQLPVSPATDSLKSPAENSSTGLSSPSPVNDSQLPPGTFMVSPLTEEAPAFPGHEDVLKPSFMEDILRSPALEEAPRSPSVESGPKSPALAEAPKSPLFEDRPRSPYAGEIPVETPESPALGSRSLMFEDTPKPPALVDMEAPRSPFFEEASKSPLLEEIPRSPLLEEKPRSPLLDEAPKSPLETPKSLLLEEAPKSPVEEKSPATEEAKSPILEEAPKLPVEEPAVVPLMPEQQSERLQTPQQETMASPLTDADQLSLLNAVEKLSEEITSLGDADKILDAEQVSDESPTAPPGVDIPTAAAVAATVATAVAGGAAIAEKAAEKEEEVKVAGEKAAAKKAAEKAKAMPKSTPVASKAKAPLKAPTSPPSKTAAKPGAKPTEKKPTTALGKPKPTSTPTAPKAKPTGTTVAQKTTTSRTTTVSATARPRPASAAAKTTDKKPLTNGDVAKPPAAKRPEPLKKASTATTGAKPSRPATATTLKASTDTKPAATRSPRPATATAATASKPRLGSSSTVNGNGPKTRPAAPGTAAARRPLSAQTKTTVDTKQVKESANKQISKTATTTTRVAGSAAASKMTVKKTETRTTASTGKPGVTRTTTTTTRTAPSLKPTTKKTATSTVTRTTVINKTKVETASVESKQLTVEEQVNTNANDVPKEQLLEIGTIENSTEVVKE